MLLIVSHAEFLMLKSEKKNIKNLQETGIVDFSLDIFLNF